MADQQVLDDFFATAKAALDLPAATYEDAYQLGSPELADELADWLKRAKKTATSSGFELYTIEQDPLPIAGVYNIILDRHDRPVALTFTDNVFVTPFEKVDAVIAKREGEGSQSLASRRRAHEAFFAVNIRQMAFNSIPNPRWSLSKNFIPFIRLFKPGDKHAAQTTNNIS